MHLISQWFATLHDLSPLDGCLQTWSHVKVTGLRMKLVHATWQGCR